jgi:mRNA-degrading endonuclease RelE of RelBE toxin-antitoxin system
MFDLRYMPPASNYFKKLKDKNLAGAYKDALTKIADDPYSAGEAKIGDLAGIYCRDVRYGKTNFEIAYRIVEDDDQIVVVILAGTRENFYQELKRYMK